MISWNKKYLILVILLAVFIIHGVVTASIPKPEGYVNDFANVLNSQSEAEISAVAKSLADNQGVELAVVTISSVAPEPAKMYATKLFNEWGIGGPEDSGLLILVVTESREIEVETGYGVEGALPDGKVGAILDQFVIPHLARNDYSRGLVEAAKAYQAELLGESFLLEQKNPQSSSELKGFLIFLAIVVIVLMNARKRPPGVSGGSGSGGTRRKTVYPTHIPRTGSGRSGGIGGGRSGGFGGFGGGRSGGGGAGRKF